MIEYADRLAWAMKNAPMDTTTLAKKLGVSYQAVKRVLEGKSAAFTAPNHARAAQLLNVSPDWLATGEGSPARNAGPWPFSASRADFEKLRPADFADLDKTLTAFISGTLARYELEEMKRDQTAIHRNELRPSSATMAALDESIEANKEVAQGSQRNASAHAARKQGGGSR